MGYRETMSQQAGRKPMPQLRRDSACSLRKGWAGAPSPRGEKCASNGKGFSKISFTNRYYLVLTLKQLIFCRFNQNIFPKILDSPKTGKWPFWTAVLSVFTPCLHQWTDPFRQGSCHTFQDNLCWRLPACFPKQQAEAQCYPKVRICPKDPQAHLKFSACFIFLALEILFCTLEVQRWIYENVGWATDAWCCNCALPNPQRWPFQRTLLPTL